MITAALFALSTVTLAAAPPPVTIDVDATDMARRIVHTKLTLPAKPGPTTLYYPKWIPGEHAPDGPILGMTNLHFSAGGKEVPWTRDDLEMFAFHVNVPAGASSLDVTLDFVTPTEGGSFSGSSAATENVGVLSWNQVLLTPEGVKSDDVIYDARLTLPKGWQAGGALAGKQTGNVIDYDAVSLTTLVDSPVIMGLHFKKVPIGAKDGPAHAVNIAADSEAALQVPADLVTEWTQLTAEAGALFGVRHYRHYDFLLTLSDHLDHFGLEHHESSDDRESERSLVDDDMRAYFGSLMPHEFVHSWNGKFRRPAGLATGDFQTPMKTEVLWVYEGLTEYLGVVLATRSGLNTPEESRDGIAYSIGILDNHTGRTWRPLADTATFAQFLYGAPSEWNAARRSVDFYDESLLVWLEVDTRIRDLTKGKKSLDDFCKIFHGGAGGKPEVKPYSVDDVIKALNDVAPYDWKGFWTEKLESKDPLAPRGGLTASGWKLAFTDEETDAVKQRATDTKSVDTRFSLGVIFKEEDSTILDVVPGSPAYLAGIGPGMKLAGVNGRKFSKEVLDDALKASVKSKDGIEILVDNGDFYRLAKVDYHGGKRYPTLVRDEKVPDVLSKIFAPQTPHAKRPAKPKKP